MLVDVSETVVIAYLKMGEGLAWDSTFLGTGLQASLNCISHGEGHSIEALG